MVGMVGVVGAEGVGEGLGQIGLAIKLAQIGPNWVHFLAQGNYSTYIAGQLPSSKEIA